MYDDQIKLKGEYEAMWRENQGEEQEERRPSKSTRTQNTTTTNSVTHSNINKHSSNTLNKSNHLAITQKHLNLAESRGNIKKVNKVNMCDKNSLKKIKKQPNFYVKESEARSVFFTNKPMILLVYKKVYFNTNDLDRVVPIVPVSLLQEFENVFPKDIANGLPPLRGIKHQTSL